LSGVARLYQVKVMGGDVMKKYIAKSTVAAIVLTMSAVAQAKDDTNVCSNATLKGSYVFAASGFNIVSGVAQPKAIVEPIIFDGKGTLTGGPGPTTISINGVILHSPPGGSPGSYQLAKDCTGVLAFPTGPTFDIFAGPEGSTIQMIQTNPNTVFRGVAERLSD
jgi:hypothetical protein